MKQGTAKTLGVAALGAAFAAAGAGSASAATGDVLHSVPLGDVTKTLPAGASESVTAGQQALDHTAGTVVPAARKGLAAVPVAKGGTRSLLGGMPVSPLPVGPVGGGTLGIG
jgi:hypothetical protein